MVEIKHTDPISSQEAGLAASGSSADSSDDGKYRLIYSKSKVYVNPTAYTRDNIPGFVALVKKVCQLWLYYAASLYIMGLDHLRRPRSPSTCSHGYQNLC